MFHCAWESPYYTNAEREAVADNLAAAGISWVRIDIDWSVLENTGKGARNAGYLSGLDSCVDISKRHGFSILMNVWATPGWANGGKGPAAPPTNASNYADIAQWLAARYRSRVNAWEVWNEQNNATFWTGTVAQYVGVLKAGYQGFKAGDSGATVVLGGLMYNDDGYLSQIYANGGKGSFDVVATHPYQGNADDPPETADPGNRYYFSHTPTVHSVMAANGDGSKPIWFTELGWSAHDNSLNPPSWGRGISEATQADYAVRAFKYAASNWSYVGVQFWYKERAWNNPSSDPEWLHVHLEGYGLLRADRSQRPVYNAIKNYLTAP